MNVRRLIIGIVAVVVLAGGGFWVYSQFLAPGTGADADPAVTPISTEGIVGSDIVTAEGRIVPQDFVNLTPLGGGQVVELLVEAGDTVSAGDPLLRLDSIDQENGVTQAAAAIQQAEANLTSAQAAVTVAENSLRAAELGVTTAQASYDLLAADPTPEQIALSAAAVAAAEAGVTAAGGSQALVLEGATSAQIAAAEAQLAAAQAQYNAALRSYQPVLQSEDADDLAKELAGYQLNAATNNLESAQAALADLQNGASTAERVAAGSAVAAAGGDVDAANANLLLLEAGTREEQLAVAQTEITQAENSVREAELQLAAAETAVVQAEAAIVEAELALQLAENALADRTVRAVTDGVVANVNSKMGETITAGVPVVTIADFSTWVIETTDLTELNVVEIGTGDTADITIDAFPDELLTGEISKIAPTAQEVLGDVTYVVTLDIEESDLPLRWGMTVFVTFDGGESE